MNLAFLVAAVCFLIAALSSVFEWQLGEFNAVAWGLFALAVGMLWPYVIPVGRRNRGDGRV